MRKVYFKSKGYSFEVETARVRGKAVTVNRVRNRDAIVVIPLVGRDKILMERQYRPVVKKWMYEVTAGHIEAGEDKIAAVRRELEEETGYMAKDIRFLFKSHTDPSLETQMEYFFLATVGARVGTHLDADERITVRAVPIKTIINMVKQNRIQGHTTIAALTYFLHYVYKK
jgi:ADP-ribose pyrophosphatase